MKRSICAIMVFSLMFSVAFFAQVKKFDLKGSSSTKKPVSTSTTKNTVSVPVPKTSANLPALPPGVKRIDVNVLQQEYFECPKCKKEFTKAGKCPIHHESLVRKTRSYTFKCRLCGYISEKEGKCPNCKGNPVLKKFEVTYQDVGCKEISSEPGKCPKCKQDLKRIINVEIKK
jgi:hypothetical protein